jgi:hypothetical protein
MKGQKTVLVGMLPGMAVKGGFATQTRSKKAAGTLLFCVLLVFGLVVTGCKRDETDDGSGSDDPKVITITNVASYQGASGVLGVFKVGTTKEQVLADLAVYTTGSGSFGFLVAGGMAAVAGGDAAVPIYDTAGNFSERWTGSGTYDVLFMVTAGANSGTIAKKGSVSIVTTETRIDAETFTVL